MFARFAAAAVPFAAAMLGGASHAYELEEFRVGATMHNITIFDDKIGYKEKGPNVEAELVFDSPDGLRWLGAPRPYAMASYNTHGRTSWAGVGLYWRIQLSENWAIEPGLGYVLHNGEIDIPYPPGDPRNQEFADKNVLLGSRDLFRDTLAIERKMFPGFAMQLYYEHLSHGQILGQGRNQGMDELGLRGVIRFRSPD